MAATSSMSDRMNVKMNTNSLKNYVSVQNALDCSRSGSCDGGDEIGVYEYAKTHGIPHDTCDTYLAKQKTCDHSMDCYTCHYNGTCTPVNGYERLFVTDYKRLSGRNAIKREIMNNGPITCTMDVTDRFEYSYLSGIYEEYRPNTLANHVVSVVGWGINDYIEYWIVRNSWGIFFGEQGFFRIVTSSYRNRSGDDWNLGIEKECSYPVMGEWR
jgi:cathepsin X